MTDNAVRLTERDALLREVFGNIRGIQEALVQLLFDHVKPEFCLFQHAGKDLQAGFPCFNRVEQALLVFLEVFIVSQRRALHDGQQLHQITVYPATLAAHQLCHVGILLLWHDAGTRAVAVIDGDICELRGVPPGKFFRPARQVHH